MEAFGMIETMGLIASIEAADTMLKSANVKLYSKQKIGAGHITVIITGDVGAVKSAVDAGVAAVHKIGSKCLLSSHVIPRPSGEIFEYFSDVKNNKEIKEVKEIKENKDFKEDLKNTENIDIKKVTNKAVLNKKAEILDSLEVEDLKAVEELKKAEELNKVEELKEDIQVVKVEDVQNTEIQNTEIQNAEIQEVVNEQLAVDIEINSKINSKINSETSLNNNSKTKAIDKKQKDSRKKNKK